MTTKVKVENTEKTNQGIEVWNVLPDGTRLESMKPALLKAGEYGFYYVHAGQSLVIDEVGAETKSTNFGYAVKALKEGKKVARASWSAAGVFIFLVPGSQFAVTRPPLLGIYPEGTIVDYSSHIDMKTANDKIIPWVSTQGDLLGEDWNVLA